MGPKTGVHYFVLAFLEKLFNNASKTHNSSAPNIFTGDFI